MTYHAFICSRSNELTPTKKSLLKYLDNAGVKTKLIIGASSIFAGYERAFKAAQPESDDTIILCHDDLEILTPWEKVKKKLVKYFNKKDTGFIGVAGTAKLTTDAVWWNKECWDQGFLRGKVRHGTDLQNSHITTFGPEDNQFGEVVVMDGVFLAAKASTLRTIELKKPFYFDGDWDFYDIYYTIRAHRKGLKNYVIDIDILHNSMGEITGKASWHKNREAFIRKNDLPREI
tara:strand:+ start:537 stop:1232 length:696 start_codon:yes stop_codon:yes gene_type:complete